MNSSQQQTDTDLLIYLQMLAGDPQRHQFFDMRYLTPEGVMRQRFVSALRVDQLARRITDLACEADVYVGAALRERANGGKSAINGSHLLYIECDNPNAKDRLDGFAHPRRWRPPRAHPAICSSTGGSTSVPPTHRSRAPTAGSRWSWAATPAALTSRASCGHRTPSTTSTIRREQ